MTKRYKTGEFAELIGVSVKTLQRWDNSNKLKANRNPSNMRFYTHEQYEQYVKEHERSYNISQRKQNPGIDASAFLLPERERLIVRQLRDFIENNENYYAVLIAGIRQTGKTTILRQLQVEYPDSIYIDLSAGKAGQMILDDIKFDGQTKLLLLDEITYLDDYEPVSQHIYNMSTRYRFKVILTGSSSAHITKLSMTKLGGRALLMRLPSIMFIEYLYLTGRIQSYDDYSNVTNVDFSDYLMLKGLENLRTQFDKNYFDTFYSEVETSNERCFMGNSYVELNKNDLLHMSNLIAYKLSEAASYDKSLGHKLKIAGKEYSSLKKLPDIKPVKWSKIDLSDAFITESYSEVQTITIKDKCRVLQFLLWAGLANIEFTKTSVYDELMDTGYILNRLKKITKSSELMQLFRDVSICLTSPLFYTRLGTDIISRMNVDIDNLCRGELLGKMLEVYIRGAVTLRSVNRIMSIVKLNFIDIQGEVDIFDDDTQLLCEVACWDKPADEVNLHRYYPNTALIRICATDSISEPYNCYHRIPYAKLCCMLDTGDIYKLQKTKANDEIQ